jgi:thiamine biosynthesis lipoprotein
VLTLALVACLSAVAVPAPSEVFLTEEQALHLAFPDADRVERVLVALTAAEREAIGAKIAPREAPRTFRRFVGRKGDEILGYAVIDDALGKSEPITYMVAVDPSLHVRRVEILAYRESRGGEVRQDGWRSQFQGKDSASPLRVGSDIRNVAGATISCRSVTDGVRYQLACLAVLARPAPVRRARLAMGTMLAITVHGLSGAAADAAIDAAFAEVERLEAILSTWREASEVSRFNHAAGGDALPASPELLDLLGKSVAWSERTGGAFDVTVGPLVELWRRAAESQVLPAESELEAARSRIGFRGIEIDLAGGRARLAKPGAAVDFGGIGKGCALDRAAAVLERAGAHQVLLDFGGQLLALDPPPGEKAWKAELRDPARPDAGLDVTCGSIELVRASISSTADYERGLAVAGRRVSHVLDPRSGRPVAGLLGASVVCPNATDADALSTALFVMGEEAGGRFAREQQLPAWLVAADGRSVETDPFRDLRTARKEGR